MARLIDADAVVGKMKRFEANSQIVSSVIKLIERQPTIDAEPVRHGRWRYVNTSQGMMCSCSECSEIPECFEPDYCPNCGAKMDGGAES